MKKCLILIVIFILLMPIHVHNDKCGYDPENNSGCTFSVEQIEPKNKWEPEG